MTKHTNNTFKIGDRVMWQGNLSDLGTVTDTGYAAITVKWDNGQIGTISVQDVPVCITSIQQQEPNTEEPVQQQQPNKRRGRPPLDQKSVIVSWYVKLETIELLNAYMEADPGLTRG